jgi:hypothetical protein
MFNILRVMYLNNINNIYIILTELILFFGSLILLFYPLFSNKKFYIRNLFFITLIILVLSFISLFFYYPNYLSIKILFYNMLIFSYYTLFIKLSIIILSLIFIYILQIFNLNLNNTFIINEFYFLYIFSILISFLAFKL